MVSDPFVIWTMRRTGGTTFMSLLSTLSEYPGTQHEPFNPDRKFGWVTQTWIERKDPQLLMEGLDQVLAERPVIKHCYELVPEAVNIALIKASSDRGYRHIVLDRESEVDRIISLELAIVTGAWGAEDAPGIYAEIESGTRNLDPIDIDEARSHMMACAALRRWLAGQLNVVSKTPLLVYFEEIYGDLDAGRRTVEEVLSCLGISPKDHPGYENALAAALTEKAQNSQSISHAVPNIDALRKALELTYAEHGFRFEDARRDPVVASSPPEEAISDSEISASLIIDVGAAKGDDTAFYLAKGYSVLAIPHDKEDAMTIEHRLKDEIAAGKLLVRQADLAPSKATKSIIDDAIAEYGVPHYIKIEAVGGERDLVTGITGEHGLPLNLSFQVNTDWQEILSHVAQLGYQEFQIVQQGAKHLSPPPHPAREGRYVPIQFTATMSGCFGRELAPENWMDLEEFVRHVTIIQTRRQEARALGKNPGWHDIHCRFRD